jgi:filamentous hemagglutinin
VYGQNNSVMFGGAASGAGAAFGYGIGNGMAAAIASTLRPTMNGSSWADVGRWAGASGLNLFVPNNLPTIGSSFGGGLGSEFGNAEINSIKKQMDGKK